MRPHRLPKLLIPCLLLLIPALAGTAFAQAPAARPHVLLLALDTLRADHLHCLGNDSIQTPHMDALAADGVLFTRCHSTAPWTLPSFASVFTSLVPYHHATVGGKHQQLPADRMTLATYLQDAGYDTGAWVTINYLTFGFRLDRGFEHFQFVTPRANDNELQANEVTGKGTYWITTPDAGPAASRKTRGGLTMNRVQYRQAGSPFFAFLHYFDVHAPYQPPAPFDRMYYEGDETAGGGEQIYDMLMSDRNRAQPKQRNKGMYMWLRGVTDLEFPVRQYAAGVSFADDHVGQVLATLKEEGLYDDTLIVLLSDHGEHLTEHEIYFTHKLPYQETMHVPLLIKLPRGRLAGTVVDEAVSLVDVLPTVLEVCGLAVPPDLDGRSLLDRMAGIPGESLILAETGALPNDYTKALVQWPWKLMVTRLLDDVTYELYNLEDDPGELRNVIDEYPNDANRLHLNLWTMIDPEEPLFSNATEERPAELDEAAKERLKALGY